MKDWSEILNSEQRKARKKFSRELLGAIGSDCLTRKPRDPEKRIIMRQLGLPERYPEVQYPSPGNTPENIEKEDI